MSISEKLKNFVAPEEEEDYAEETEQSYVVVVQPDDNEEKTKYIVDSVKNNKVAIININKMKQEKAQRLIDFLTGAAYAIGGKIEKVEKTIYLFTSAGTKLDVPKNYSKD